MNLIRVIAALCLMAFPAVAAEQSSYVLPTTGPMNLGSLISTYINPGLRSLASCSNGPTAPANGPSGSALLGQCWFDTSSSPTIHLKYWDGTAWSTLAALNASTHVWAMDVVYYPEIAITYGTTTTINLATVVHGSITLAGNITTQTVSGAVAGKKGRIAFVQDGTGSRTTVWNTIWKFSGGTLPTLSTGAGKTDFLIYDCVTVSFCIAELKLDVR